MTTGSKISKKILLIDDERTVLSALKLILQAFGYVVTTFEHPKSALEHLGVEADYQLIISDLRMPELSGFDVLRYKNAHHPTIPFILISGHATSEEVEEATALGAQTVLLKPFDPQSLKRAVEGVLTSF